MSKLLKRISGMTLGLAICFGFSFGCSNKSSSSQMARADGNSVSYDFTNITGFSSWTSSYGEHTVPYTEGDVYFKSANKQSGTITDRPVTKGNYVTFAFNETYSASYQITSATFVCKQWGNKAQTITLHTSSDGGTTFASTDVTSTNFSITSNSLPDNTNALKITFSSTSNQVGITSLTYEYESISGGTTYTSYTVTAHYNDGITADLSIASSTSNGKIAKPSDPTRDGYEFIGWYPDNSSETQFDFTQVITGDCDIYARWEKAVTKLATPAPTFDNNSKEVSWADVNHAQSYTLVVDGETTVENATSPYSVASLSSGVRHTITVKAIGDGTDYTDSDDGTCDVAFLGHAGTEADPYTVEDARLAIDSNIGKSNVYVRGTVSNIADPYSSQYGNISYDISSDGLTTSPQLRVFRGKSYSGANFTSENDIQVGDVVVVKGNLTYYTKDSLYEFEANNQLVSLVRDNGKILDSVVIDGEMTKTTYFTNQQWDHAGITLSAVYEDGSVEDVTNLVSTWTYSYATPADMGVTETAQELLVTAYYGEEFDSLTVYVNVEEPTTVDTYHLSGRKYIYEQVSADSDRLYMNIDKASSKEKPAVVKQKGEASTFLFTLVGDDTYTITDLDGTKGLYYPGSDNTVCWGANGKDYQWKVEAKEVIKTAKDGSTTLYGTYNFIGKDSNNNNRYLCSYSGSDWRTYDKEDHSNRSAMIQVETAKIISGFSVDTTNANKNVLKGTYFDAKAAADAGFVAQMDYTDGTHEPITTGVTWALETSIVSSEAVLTVSYPGYDDVEITGMNVYAPTMVSLSIDTTTNNVKTTYLVGDALDVSGVVITGVDGSNHLYDIPVSECTFSPANGATLTSENTEVTVSYKNEDNSVATGSYPISVNVFSGYTKVTSTDDLEVGATYVIGVDTSNPTYRLMGETADNTGAKTYRKAVDASSVTSTDATRVTDTAPTSVGASTFTLLKNASGQYAFYDLGNSKYLTGYTNSGDNHLNDSASFSDASWWTISFSSNVMSATLSGTSRVLAYNYNSGNDPRFATYGGYSANISHIALFKMDGSSIMDNVTTFANKWLMMNDENYAGDIETPNCAENYENMTIAYILLNDAERNVFQYSDDFAAARARLNNWATANGQVFTYGNEEPFAALRKTGVNGDILSATNDSSLIILFIISTLGAGALSAFYLMKKKKRV